MVNSIERMTQAIAGILADNKPTLYLFGSVVLGDFKLGWSDIDIACFTETPLSQAQADELVMLRQTLLTQEPGNPYYRSFEGIITTWRTVAEHAKETVVYWGTSGQRLMNAFEIDAFSLINIIKYGVLLHGEDHRERLPFPTQDQMNAALTHEYDTIRKYAAQTGASLYSAGWILDIARCLYTAKTQDILAKTKAGQWALDNGLVPEPEIMEKVLDIRKHPLLHAQNEETKNWMCSLGPHIQRFADILFLALQEG